MQARVDQMRDDRDDDSVGKRCAHCRDPIETSEWYPIVTRTDDHGELRMIAFCSEACRDAWIDE